MQTAFWMGWMQTETVNADDLDGDGVFSDEVQGLDDPVQISGRIHLLAGGCDALQPLGLQLAPGISARCY